MAAGTLVEWRVQPGSAVKRGDVVALVETENGVIDIESYVDGTVESLVVAPHTRVPVGTVLALFTGAPEVAAMPAPTPVALTPAAAATAASPEAATAPAARSRISPAARARAAALGLDLSALKATGPDGVVALRDVEAAAQAPAPQASPGAGMRRAIAASMSRSKREIPHYYLQLGMDLGPTLQWLEAHNAAVPVPERLLLAALQIKAVARAAAQKPGFSGWFEQDRFAPAPAVNVGMAIALRGGGLVAPAISAADSKRLPVVMQELQDLVARVRRGHLRSTELSSATITITSLGDEGVDTLWPIIHPPQVAIVGFGSPLNRPWVVDQQVLPRPVMNISLAADHRVSDGRQGAQFLARVRDLLAKPAEL
jgi:pyruvate dehydrogenase E2 component (dihydrolipoamide acetyltransferase)